MKVNALLVKVDETDFLSESSSLFADSLAQSKATLPHIVGGVSRVHDSGPTGKKGVVVPSCIEILPANAVKRSTHSVSVSQKFQ